MSFSLRQALATAIAVALAIAIASALVFVLVRGELRGRVDDGLRAQARGLERAPLGFVEGSDGQLVLRGPRRGPGFEGRDVFLQAVRGDGTVARSSGDQVAFPVDERTLAAARGETDAFFEDATVAGVHARIYTVPGSRGFALQLLRPLGEVDETLRRTGWILLFVALGGIGVAALLGALVARAALAPVRRLTREAETVAETQDLGHRIDVHGDDELSRLGASFNTMLGALEQSQQAQRQLVADASHELRTPLTSLRTNIEVLARQRELPDAKRESLLRDVVGQLEEMSELVGDLVEVASEPAPELEASEVQLDELTDEVLSRARRLSPQVTIRAELEPTLVYGVPSRIERAIANLVDNAVKWSPAGGEIVVSVVDGTVTVRDYGPGIADEDLPHVFDRFYRAASARPLPGSGLGLAIVRQVAAEHHGTASVERADGGGTLAKLALPEIEQPPAAG